jgi:hypothetical protein
VFREFAVRALGELEGALGRRVAWKELQGRRGGSGLFCYRRNSSWHACASGLCRGAEGLV